MNRTRELKIQKDELIKRAQALLDVVDAENRGLTEAESAEYDELIKKIEYLNAEIERREKLFELAVRNVQENSDAKIGMGERDLRNYSLVRAIRAIVNGNWKGAELEYEASEATAKKLGKEPRGFFVPLDWMEYRDLTKGTPAQGGYLVATDLLSQSFIDLLRNKMMVQRAGATVLGGLVGDIAIPKQSGGATAYWVAEGNSPTESQLAVAQVAMSPKTVGAFTDITRKLLLQSSVDVERLVRSDLAATLAIAIDYAALHGSGTSNQPRGIANTTGIGSVVGGANGAAPTWEHIVKLETEVAIDNADIGALAYMTNPKVRGKLKVTPRTPTYGDIMVWESNNTPLNGYPAYVTNQVRSDLDKGTSTGVCSAIFFGNWNDLLIGMWGTLDIMVDPYTQSTSGTIRVVALQDVDIAVRYPESFAAMLDALTT